MATTIPQENTAAIAANTEAISDLAAALAAEIENRRQIVDRAGAAAMEAVDGVLRSGFMPWEFSGYSEGVEISGIAYAEGRWSLELDYGGSHYSLDAEGGPDASELYFAGQYKEPEDTIRAARHLVTPTKTSQLTNDGAPNGGGTPYATTGQLPSASSSPPQMDGVASPGSGSAYSRGDHVHPSDTSKLDGEAAYPAWNPNFGYEGDGEIVSYAGRLWENSAMTAPGDKPTEHPEFFREKTLDELKQDKLSDAQIGYINAVPSKAPLASPALTGIPTAPTAASGTNTTQIATTAFVHEAVSVKADKVSGATAGNLAALNAQGNLEDSGVKPSDFAAKADLPYAMVTPGEWEFSGSGVQSGVTYSVNESIDSLGEYGYHLLANGVEISDYPSGSDVPLTVVDFSNNVYADPAVDITATRPSLPGHLLDRAVNTVAATGATTLTLPPAVAGRSRDFYVKLDLSPGATVSFVAASGESAPLFVSYSPSVGSGVWHFTEVAAGTYSVTECGAAASTTAPLMDSGNGAAGTSAKFARADHVHPSDTAKQDVLTAQQLAAVNSGATAAKVATWDGYAAQIAAKANSADVNAALAQKANITDLPYALVTPGEWAFSGSGYDPTKTYVVDEYEQSTNSLTIQYGLFENGDMIDQVESNSRLTTVSFPIQNITATRASLPGHLCDRAGNRVVVTGDTMLTLPAAVPGYIRDFLVRLEISGSTVPTITFAAPTGETITYETDGDEFPVPDEEGTWPYSFTETAAHTFAVALKKVNAVTQGGS